jgi:hypothetical protein
MRGLLRHAFYGLRQMSTLRFNQGAKLLLNHQKAKSNTSQSDDFCLNAGSYACFWLFLTKTHDFLFH